MKRITGIVGGVAVLSALALAGCGQQTGTNGNSVSASSSNTSGHKYTVGVSMYSLTNPYFSAMKNSLIQEGAKDGITVNVEASNGDQATQLSQIQSFIQQKVDALVIVPQDSKSIVTAVKAANAANIPVFFIDADADQGVMKQDGAKEVEVVESDNYQLGVNVAQELVSYLGKNPSAEIGVVNFPTALSCQLRDKGFMSVISKYPGIKIVATQNGEVSETTGLQVGSEMLQGHPNISAIFSDTEPAAQGVLQAIQSQNKVGKVALFGESSAKTTIQEIEQNTIFKAGAQQQPMLEAQIEMDNIAKYLNHQKVPAQVLVPVPKVTKDNAQQAYAKAF
jgi:ribose transport system substrate-binding protein